MGSHCVRCEHSGGVLWWPSNTGASLHWWNSRLAMENGTEDFFLKNEFAFAVVHMLSWCKDMLCFHFLAKTPAVSTTCWWPFSACLQKCYYCQNYGRPSPRGALIQCSSGKCRRLMHVTCAYRPDVQIVPGDWPVILRAVCDRHKQSKVGLAAFATFMSCLVNMTCLINVAR